MIEEIVDKEELGRLIPNLRDPWLGLFHRAALAGVARLAPHVVAGTDPAEEAKLIVVRAIQRVFNTKTWARSESAGPFSITYVTGGRGLFDAEDRAELAALGPNIGAVLPSGSFDPPRDYDRLFVRPGMPRWRL